MSFASNDRGVLSWLPRTLRWAFNRAPLNPWKLRKRSASALSHLSTWAPTITRLHERNEPMTSIRVAKYNQIILFVWWIACTNLRNMTDNLDACHLSHLGAKCHELPYEISMVNKRWIRKQPFNFLMASKDSRRSCALNGVTWPSPIACASSEFDTVSNYVWIQNQERTNEVAGQNA